MARATTFPGFHPSPGCKPDGTQYNFTFDANSNILSGTDSQGKLLEAHTYGPNNNGLTSTQAYGVNSVSLTY